MPAAEAKPARQVTWTSLSWGQCFSACRISRQVIEARVDSGMAGMCPIMAPGRGCPRLGSRSLKELHDCNLPGERHGPCRGAGHADRIGTQDLEETGPGSEDVLAGPAAGAGRAGGCPRPGQ